MTEQALAPIGALQPAAPREEDPAKEQLLTALDDFRLPPLYGLLFMGSLAEGFGNHLSDIDAIVIDPEPRVYPAFRQITWNGERRVEVFFRSCRDLEALARRVNDATPDADGGYATVDGDDLDLYHRICFGVPMLDVETVERARASFDHRRLIAVVSANEARNAAAACERAAIARVMEMGEAAIPLCRDYVFRAAVHWASLKGQTYPSNKFLIEKLTRAGMSKAMRSRVRALTGSGAVRDAARFHRECEALAVRLGGPIADAAGIRVELMRPLRLIELLGATWLAGDREVYVVHPGFADAARAIAGRGFRAEPLALADEPMEGRTLWGELYRHGLVKATGPSGGSYSIAAGTTLKSARFAITWNGMAPADPKNRPVLHCVPLPVETIVAIGLDLIRCGMFFSNKKEDAIGAIRVHRWSQVEDAFRGMTLLLSQAAALSAGGYPAPSESAILGALQAHPSTAAMAARARAAFTKPVRNAKEAKAAFAAVMKVFECLPRAILGDLIFSMETSRAGHQMLEKIMTWGDLGERLGVGLPIFQNEWPQIFEVYRGRTDLLLNRYLDGESLRAEEDRIEGWARVDDVKSEIDRQL